MPTFRSAQDTPVLFALDQEDRETNVAVRIGRNLLVTIPPRRKDLSGRKNRFHSIGIDGGNRQRRDNQAGKHIRILPTLAGRAACIGFGLKLVDTTRHAGVIG